MVGTAKGSLLIRRIVRAPVVGAVSFVAAMVCSPASAYGQADTTVVKPATSRYFVFRGELEDRPGAPQVAVSRGTYKVNFGSREGVKPGSIFDVYSGRSYEAEGYVGIVRVERVWRDSAQVRIVNLEHKSDPDAALPIGLKFRLFPKYVLLETVHFNAGKPVFTAEMNERLRFAARFILSFPSFPVILEGHTDNTGKKETNASLGVSRAQEIGRFLHEIHVIPSEQMHAIGYADQRPVATNSTPEGRRENRRVDIVMVDRLPD